MTKILFSELNTHFSTLSDPRIETTNRRHKFIDIIVIAITGIICGADDFSAIAQYGKSRKDWFRGFLELPNGIPSHDTFNDVFAKICPEEFRRCFISWTSSICELFEGEVIAIDGKTLRGSHDRSRGNEAIHIVSAWAAQHSLVLGQLKTAGKSNEITAIPELLNLLDIQRCLVTIDAMGCQWKIAESIIDKQADYLLAVKDNQPKLHRAIIDYFAAANENAFDGYRINYHETHDTAHGRVEERRCWVGYDLENITNRESWKGLSSVVMIESERTLNNNTSIEHRYYICSSQSGAEKILEATRAHWRIENSLHWVLDVAFREDDARLRKDNAAENVAILRHIALNLLKNEKTAKVGVKNKRLMAGWDISYMKKVLNGLRL